MTTQTITETTTDLVTLGSGRATHAPGRHADTTLCCEDWNAALGARHTSPAGHGVPTCKSCLRILGRVEAPAEPVAEPVPAEPVDAVDAVEEPEAGEPEVEDVPDAEPVVEAKPKRKAAKVKAEPKPAKPSKPEPTPEEAALLAKLDAAQQQVLAARQALTDALAAREQLITAGLADGLSGYAIAKRLGITYSALRSVLGLGRKPEEG